jgi:predicted esterase
MPIKICNGLMLNSWFDYLHPTDLSETAYNLDQAQDSAEDVADVIFEEIGLLKGDSKKVFVMGFSQGAAQALYTGMVFNQPLGGVACLSGHKLVETPFLNNINNETPVLIVLGLNDETLPYQDAYASYRIGSILQKKPNITFHKIANSDHSMDEEVLEIVRDWILGSCVGSTGSKKKLLGGTPSLLMISRGLKERSRRPKRV